MSRIRASHVLVIAFALLTLTGVFAAYYLARNSAMLDSGYDLRASDVRGDGETRRLIAMALRAEAAGDRANARKLFEAASQRVAETALPAAFLASFSEQRTHWARTAIGKLEGASAYESALVHYLLERHSPSRIEAVLELRPDAWRLRLAAAELHLARHDREAARRELMKIDIRKLDDRKLMHLLADRASLGDTAGAEHDLRRSRLVRRPASLHYTEARIAWSLGDAPRAAMLFDRASDAAAKEKLGAIEAESRELAGLALLKFGSFDEAGERFAKQRTFSSVALAAYAAHRAGDAEKRDRLLTDARALEPRSAALRLLALRMRSPLAWNIEAEPAAAASIAAREALLRGDRASAMRELSNARAADIDDTPLREEAELIAAELGLPSRPLPPDPPYPNVLRCLAIFDHPSISTRTGVSR